MKSRTLPDDAVRYVRSVAAARKLQPTDRELAAQFGCSVALIRAIIRGDRYRHVTGSA